MYNKKFFIILIMLLLLTSCNTNNKDDTKGAKHNIKQIDNKFGDLTKYIKPNITDNESKKLQDILSKRKEKQAEIKKMLETATKDNKDMIYKKVVDLRAEYIKDIILYV